MRESWGADVTALLQAFVSDDRARVARSRVIGLARFTSSVARALDCRFDMEQAGADPAPYGSLLTHDTAELRLRLPARFARLVPACNAGGGESA